MTGVLSTGHFLVTLQAAAGAAFGGFCVKAVWPKPDVAPSPAPAGRVCVRLLERGDVPAVLEVCNSAEAATLSAQGYHLFYRTLGPGALFWVDMDQKHGARPLHEAMGLCPLAVVETSAGNYHAYYKAPPQVVPVEARAMAYAALGGDPNSAQRRGTARHTFGESSCQFMFLFSQECITVP